MSALARLIRRAFGHRATAVRAAVLREEAAFIGRLLDSAYPADPRLAAQRQQLLRALDACAAQGARP